MFNISTKLLLLTLFFISNDLFAERIEKVFAPQDTNKVSNLKYGKMIQNNEGGYAIIGTLSLKQVIQYQDYPSGIFVINFVPDVDSIYKIKYYAEYSFEKPLNIDGFNTDAYFKDNGNLVVVNCHDYYYSGPLGNPMYKLPLLIEFDNKGDLVRTFADTTTKYKQLFGQYNPIVFNSDKNFYLFNHPTDTTFSMVVACKFDSDGNYIEPYIIKKKHLDSTSEEQGVYSPYYAISDGGKGFYLYCQFNRTYNTWDKKISAVIIKIDSNMNYVKEYEIADFTNDNIANSTFTNSNINSMFLNQQNELVVSGYHFLNGRKFFVYIFDVNSLELIRKKEWYSDYLSRVVLQNSNGKYLNLGSSKKGNSNFYSYSSYLLDTNFTEEYVIANNQISNISNGFGDCKEVAPGVYDFWGYQGNNLLFVRASENDFISGVTEPVRNDGATISYSNGRLSLKLPELGLANIQIFDILGNKIHITNKYLSNSSEQIPISILEKGVYIVSILLDNGNRYTGKILVE